MDKKYYIIKKGFCIHGVYGPYETRDEALKAFSDAISNLVKERHIFDPFDGHHDYFIQHGLNQEVGENLMVDNDPIPYELNQGCGLGKLLEELKNEI